MEYETIDASHLMNRVQMRNIPEFDSAGFDPYSVMMKRKRIVDGDEIPKERQVVNDADVDELSQFCSNHGIMGFNCGTMSPRAALRMLRSKMGYPTEEKSNISKATLLLG